MYELLLRAHFVKYEMRLLHWKHIGDLLDFDRVVLQMLKTKCRLHFVEWKSIRCWLYLGQASQWKEGSCQRRCLCKNFKHIFRPMWIILSYVKTVGRGQRCERDKNKDGAKSQRKQEKLKHIIWISMIHVKPQELDNYRCQ